MRLINTGALLGAALSFGLLTACGGGGGDAGHDANPLSAGGSLVVNVGTSNIRAGSYQLDTSYEGASSTAFILGQIFEFVSPENPAFDAVFMFSQNDPRKFIIDVIDNTSMSVDSDIDYACRSSAWTSSELSNLAGLFNDPGFLTMPVCAASVSIDARNHRMQFDRLLLTDVDNPRNTITVSANTNWVLQSAPFRGTGSGSGSVTSTPVSSSGSAVLVSTVSP